MLEEHPDYVEPFLSGKNIKVKGEKISPSAHIAVEAITQIQINKGEPIEAQQAYNALIEDGIDAHLARHAVGSSILEMLWHSFYNNLTREQSKSLYIKKLREFVELKSKHPFFNDIASK